MNVSVDAQKVQHILPQQSIKNELDWFSNCEKDSCNFYFEKQLNSLLNLGYIEASLDSLVSKTDSLQYAYWHIGEKYTWQKIDQGNIAPAVLKQANISDKLFETVSPQQIEVAQERILSVYENSGYPFASLSLNNFQFLENNQISAAWWVEKNRYITIDSLIVQGDIKPDFMHKVLQIKKNEAYNEQKIQAIAKRIAELPYIKQVRPPLVEFVSDKAQLSLFLEKKQVSKFDLIVGFLPQSNDQEAMKITGDGLLNLVNAFGMGEQVKLKYSGLPNSSRQLNTQLNYPYLPFVQLGVEAKFDLYIQDTTFRTTNTYVGFEYNLGLNNTLQFFFENKTTAILTFDEAQLLSTRILPDILDMSNNYYGLLYSWQNLDYLYNPLKGWKIQLNTAIGTKKITENIRIINLETDDNFNFGSLYDSLSIRNLQIKSAVEIAKFWQLGKLTTLQTKIVSKVIRNIANQAEKSTIIHQNEQFRIGGNHDLRGFDEQSILTDLYNILTLEIRYLIGKNSNAFIFTDIAQRSNLLLENNINDLPYGFGVGVNFETKAGIFGLSYALGSQQNNPIQVKAAKIHFGYQNYF